MQVALWSVQMRILEHILHGCEGPQRPASGCAQALSQLLQSIPFQLRRLPSLVCIPALNAGPSQPKDCLSTS